MSDSYYYTWSKQSEPKNISISHAKGPILYLESEKPILDLSSISFQACFGMTNPFLAEKIIQQLKNFSVSFPKSKTELKTKVTKRLLQFMDKPDGKIFYTTSGAETIENALKMAREISKAKTILCRSKSYHGSSLGALSITGDWRNEPHFTVDEWTQRIPEPEEEFSLEKTEEIINKIGAKNIAAFCLETIAGGNGVYPPSKKWWSGIQSLCDKYDIFLILDEVVCGFYRTGTPFGYNHYEINPAFIVMSKGITGGMIPFGALWTSPEIAQFYENTTLSCGLTNYAHPLGLAVLDGILELFEDPEFIQHIDSLAKIFSEKVFTWAKLPFVKEIRTQGLLCAIELDISPSWEYFIERGLNVIMRGNQLMLAPPFIYEEKDFLSALGKLEEALIEFKNLDT